MIKVMIAAIIIASILLIINIIVLYPISNVTAEKILNMDCLSLHKEVVHNDTFWQSDQWIQKIYLQHCPPIQYNSTIVNEVGN